MLHNNLKKKMENLYFIPNNILTKFFKELTKYKNDYQQYFNYIRIILCILLYIFKYIHAYAWSYKLVYINSQNLEKIQLDFNWILNFVPCVLFNF